MKKFGRQPGRDEVPSTRTGPRARAAQERRFSDPYQHAARPTPGGSFERTGSFERRERGDDTRRASVITLDADVARVFRDSEAVNEALRLVMRLARLASGRPPFRPDRTRPAMGRPPGRESSERRGPPRPRGPRFDQK